MSEEGQFWISVAIIFALLVLYKIISSTVEFCKKRAEQKLIFETFKRDTGRLVESTSQQYPWLAEKVADLEYCKDEQVENWLRYKPHPAKRAADEVAAIKRDKREITKKCKMYEYQLQFLEALFPWLHSFEQLAPKEAAMAVVNADTSYDEAKKWLSPDEYNKLSVTKKNQLALDRYQNRKRSEWEAGIDYERYVGWTYENDGYSVEYVGATHGKADRGIDLIAQKCNIVEVVQCKRYSATKNKLVHENSISQLFGVTTVYNLENPENVASPVIYTTSTLSKEAKHFAEFLKIRVIENDTIAVYPMVKCNINKNGEKIYHLPFDQQYDKVRIDRNKGEMYVATVAEAEKKGFRRAKKWIGTN